MQINRYGKILVGLTGNIASGKSYTLKMFDDKLFLKIDSDAIARTNLLKIKRSDLPVRLRNKVPFGQDGKIDKDRLSILAFSDRDVMRELEEVIHPVTIRDIENLLVISDRKIAIIESAIIFESKLQRLFDKIITVFSPYEVRIKRLIKRAKIDYMEAKKRIDFQMDEYQKILFSDYVICNSKDRKWLRIQVKNVERSLLSLLQIKSCLQ